MVHFACSPVNIHDKCARTRALNKRKNLGFQVILVHGEFMSIYFFGNACVPRSRALILPYRPYFCRPFSNTKEFPRLQRLREVLESEQRNGIGYSRATAWPAVIESIPHLSKPFVLSQHENPLIDSFGRQHSYLRLSVVERCSLRCTYCMPESGIDLTPKHALLSRDELLQLTALFVRLGVKKVRITGGEPLVRSDIVEIVKSLDSMRSIGLETIAMTTNAVTLGSKLLPLRNAGLDCLNISLDTLDPNIFEKISRRPQTYLHKILESIEEATHLGFRKIKINSVMLKGINDHEIADLASLTEKWDIDVRFLELMPFFGNNWQRNEVVTLRDIRTALKTAFPSIKAMPTDANDTGDVTHLWRISSTARANVGVITTMTSAFCSTCTRLRLTADGHVRVCLHDNDETHLLPLLRQKPEFNHNPLLRNERQNGECDPNGQVELPLPPLPSSLEHLKLSPQQERAIIQSIGSAVSRKRKVLGGNGELFRKIMSGEPLQESIVGMLRPMTKIGG